MTSGLSTEWPFLVGQGPFLVKGIAYSFHMDYVASQVAGGAAAQHAQFTEPGLREFFEQPFFATSWYDVHPLIQAGHACGRITQLGFEEFVRVRGRHQVEQDLGLVRRALLRVLSPASLAIRVPRINASYFDFVQVQSNAVGKDTVQGLCRGLPGAVLRWYQLVTETFIDQVIARGGATNRSVSWSEPSLTGSAHGVPVYSVQYEVRWSRR